MLGLAGAACATCALRSVALADDQEAQIGQQVYDQLRQKGELIPRPNPMYAALDPIAARIKRIADPLYDYPFQFFLVHEKSPNAFAVPGGHVYVTDSLMHFAKYRDELAGVLSHEVSHDIHHDVVNLQGKQQGSALVIGLLGSLFGADRSQIGQLAENLVFSYQTNKFSRSVESNADRLGAQICAKAGYNPYGLVWLFEQFESAGSDSSGIEFLSDHPSNQARIAALEQEFANDPALFGKFSSDQSSAARLTIA
jgi:predicted Zn-dependent protease